MPHTTNGFLTLEAFRKEMGWTYEELAQKLKVTRSTAWAWCADRADARALVPSRKQMPKVAALTGGRVSPASFYAPAGAAA